MRSKLAERLSAPGLRFKALPWGSRLALAFLVAITVAAVAVGVVAYLALSVRRAEAVARALTDVFGIPPENLVTQGYGEQYLKVNTQEREEENRRVAIRRITPLVNPVASAN